MRWWWAMAEWWESGVIKVYAKDEVHKWKALLIEANMWHPPRTTSRVAWCMMIVLLLQFGLSVRWLWEILTTPSVPQHSIPQNCRVGILPRRYEFTHTHTHLHYIMHMKCDSARLVFPTGTYRRTNRQCVHYTCASIFFNRPFEAAFITNSCNMLRTTWLLPVLWYTGV